MVDFRKRQHAGEKIQAYETHQGIVDIAKQLSSLRMESRLQRDDDLHNSSSLNIDHARMESI